MSLTSDITSVVARADALITTFDTKAAAIDAAVADAIAAVPSMTKTFYVDAVNGDDNNAGTNASPLRTVAKAVALTPFGGKATIRLLSDIHVAADITVDGKAIELVSFPEAGARRRLTFERGLADGSRTLAGFATTSWGRVSLRLLTVDLPDSTGYEAAPAGRAAIFKPAGGSVGAFLSAYKISYCDVRLALAPFAPLIDQYGSSPTLLHWYSNTMLDQGPTGRLFSGFTDKVTGTPTASLAWLVTNLSVI